MPQKRDVDSERLRLMRTEGNHRPRCGTRTHRSWVQPTIAPSVTMRLEWRTCGWGVRLLFGVGVRARLEHFLVLFGGWGLFGISFLDSSFLSFPLVNDLLLIHLASQSPGRALIYALQSTAGSVLGASTVYAISCGGWSLVRRKRGSNKVSRVQQWLGQNAFVAMLVASLLPPPVPFKLFAISAGVLRVNFLKFGSALLVGRSLRFIVGALLGAHYGARAETYLKENIGWTSLVAVALIVAMTFLYRWASSRLKERRPETLGPPSSDSH